LLLAAFASNGCGRSSDVLPVQGKVSYRGEPVTNGSITFFPAQGRPESAPLSDEGAYEIHLPPGDYRVTINVGLTLPPGWKEGDPVPRPTIVLPPQYSTPAKSALTAQISPELTESIDFPLQ
jgi:hypothetical protein